MWIFTKDGFYSAVQHNQDASMLQVRARRQDDLERLAAALECDADIIAMDDADYRYRMNVRRDEFAGYMVEAVDDITYTTNVKGTLARGDSARQHAMMDVWSAMYRLQIDSAFDDIDEELWT